MLPMVIPVDSSQQFRRPSDEEEGGGAGCKPERRLIDRTTTLQSHLTDGTGSPTHSLPSVPRRGTTDFATLSESLGSKRLVTAAAVKVVRPSTEVLRYFPSVDEVEESPEATSSVRAKPMSPASAPQLGAQPVSMTAVKKRKRAKNFRQMLSASDKDDAGPDSQAGSFEFIDNLLDLAAKVRGNSWGRRTSAECTMSDLLLIPGATDTRLYGKTLVDIRAMPENERRVTSQRLATMERERIKKIERRRAFDHSEEAEAALVACKKALGDMGMLMFGNKEEATEEEANEGRRRSVPEAIKSYMKAMGLYRGRLGSIAQESSPMNVSVGRTFLVAASAMGHFLDAYHQARQPQGRPTDFKSPRSSMAMLLRPGQAQDKEYSARVPSEGSRK
jgi:hypothetical protein